MRILGWNINALPPTVRNAVLKYGSGLKGLFEDYGGSDIVCLQETKVREDKLTKELVCVDGFQSFWAISREKKGYSGVATYASTQHAPVSCEIDCLGSGEEDLDREGRVVITDHQAFVLVNVYVPNAGDRPARTRLDFKIRFLQALKAKCDSLVAAGREVVITGDLNIAASPQDVHPTMNYGELYSPEERGALLGLLGSYTDVWRRLHPDTTDVYSVWDEYTGARQFNRGLRIDYFLVTPGLLDRVVSCEMVPTPAKWSDHTGMVLELRDIPAVPPHPPCPQWSKLLKRFHDASQPSIAALFGRKKQPAAAQQKPAAAAAGAAARDRVPASSRQQQLQQQQEEEGQVQAAVPQQQQQQQQQRRQREEAAASRAAATPPAAAPPAADAGEQQAGTGSAAACAPAGDAAEPARARVAAENGAQQKAAQPGEPMAAGQAEAAGAAEEEAGGSRSQSASGPQAVAAGGKKKGTAAAGAAAGGGGGRKRKGAPRKEPNSAKEGKGSGGQRNIASFFKAPSQEG